MYRISETLDIKSIMRAIDFDKVWHSGLIRYNLSSSSMKFIVKRPNDTHKINSGGLEVSPFSITLVLIYTNELLKKKFCLFN